MNLFGRIGSRLLRWFLVVALIPLLFMGYQGYFFAKRAVEREVFLHMQAVAESKRRAIEQWFDERKHDMHVLAANPALASAAPDTVMARQVLTSFLEKSPQYVVLTYWRTSYPGSTINVPTDGELMDPPSDHHVSDEGKGPAIPDGTVYLHPKYGPAVNFHSAIRDRQSQAYIGEIRATVALANTLNPIILDTTGLGSSGQAYLVDTAMVMLTPSRFMNHPNPLTHKMDFAGPRAALAGKPGSGIYDGFGGQKVMAAWEYMPERKWALIAEMDASEAFAPLAMLRRNAIIVALLTFAAILFVVALVSRSISLPIRRLADASLAVSQGDLDRRVAVKLNDEVGELAERFNRMVTSLRDSQRQLVQSERLAAIGELVASVVHEIRNPLSAIKMNMRILEHKCDTSPVIAEHFELANAQMERLEAMLKELLDYSKPVRLEKHPISLGELVKYAIRHLPESPGETKIATRLADPNQTVNVDAAKIEQVLLNLLQNAKQAISDGGTITISSREDHGDVSLSISDTGHGISADNLKHIFEPFFTTRKQGTGLGLSNAKKIIEAHGGQIVVKSEEEKGTEVVVGLPT